MSIVQRACIAVLSDRTRENADSHDWSWEASPQWHASNLTLAVHVEFDTPQLLRRFCFPVMPASRILTPLASGSMVGIHLESRYTAVLVSHALVLRTRSFYAGDWVRPAPRWLCAPAAGPAASRQRPRQRPEGGLPVAAVWENI